MTALTMEAFRRGVTPPSPQILAKYGMTAEEWLGLLKAQGWKCPICVREAKDLKLVTDHEHIAGWHKLSGKEKAKYTRGILCSYCNHRRVHSTISGEIAQRIADYIAAYEQRTGRVAA